MIDRAVEQIVNVTNGRDYQAEIHGILEELVVDTLARMTEKLIDLEVVEWTEDRAELLRDIAPGAPKTVSPPSQATKSVPLTQYNDISPNTLCPICGQCLARQEGCLLCPSCGWSQCG